MPETRTAPRAAVTPVGPLGMIVLRGDLATLAPAVEAETGCAAPEQRMLTRSGEAACLWMSPDELLLTCPHGEARGLARRLAERLTGEFATVAEVSDARVAFDMAGPQADAALARLTPANLREIAPAEVRRSRLAQVAGAFWREGDGWRIVCFRSVGTYVETLLRNAAGEVLVRQEHGF